MDNTNTTATDNLTFWMRPADIAATQEKITNLRKLAAKLGVPTDVALHLGETAEVTELHMGTGIKYTVTKTLVTLTGTTLVLPGEHELAATLDIDPAGTIIRNNPAFTAAEVPAEFHNADGTRCDHCGIRQHRKQAVVVWNATDGFKQIGYRCVKPYLGIDPATLLRFVGEISTVTEFMGISLNTATETDLFVRLAALATLTYGFVKSGSDHGTPTRYVVDAAMHSRKFGEQFPEMAQASQAVRDAAADLATKATEWVQTQQGGEYITNLRIAAAREFATRNEGLLASLPNAYLRVITEQAEKAAKADKPASQHIAAEGTKVTFTGTVTAAKVNDGDYGVTVWFQIVTDTGSLVWYTTSPGTAACEALDAAHEAASPVQVTATVKACRTNRNNENVTVVTRAKVLSPVASTGWVTSTGRLAKW